jgi:hypothetical protein
VPLLKLWAPRQFDTLCGIKSKNRLKIELKRIDNISNKAQNAIQEQQQQLQEGSGKRKLK